MFPPPAIQSIRSLEDLFRRQKLSRPRRIQRYDQGAELTYDVTGVQPASPARIKARIERFVGGGYAGQVYKVSILEVSCPGASIPGLEPGATCAVKILVPVTDFGRWFRNFVYAVGFQGPFSPQVNPDALRAGALWQKMIRRAAALRLGSEKAVVDVLATFFDRDIGSCGEISEWIDGRMWRFEVDDNLDARKKWTPGQPFQNQGSPEYLAKKSFMAGMVDLMHEMGARELARQYEWWTCKSQPNALKRRSSDGQPDQGHVAVDFRAGLALLPFLPMCPADLWLIVKGIFRGSWVQFDRGDTSRLKTFIDAHPETFSDSGEAMAELERRESSYRDSLPDISHHRFRLLTRSRLRASILRSSIQGWAARHIIDDQNRNRLLDEKSAARAFYILGIVPGLGNFIRRICGHRGYRRHYARLFSSLDYFRRAGRGRIAESLIRWLRSGRVTEVRAGRLSRHSGRFIAHLPLSILPPALHRFFSDRRFAAQTLRNIFIQPFLLYFKPQVREEWMKGIIRHGLENGMLAEDEADRIERQIKEPFIQKYLKSLAVHVCTLPITQIVSVLVATIYLRLHPELSWAEASLRAGLILGLFQVIPISPGSVVRGLYVTFLVLREKDIRDYNIAWPLSFFKYIGYLAFPIQMAYRYPDLARFMAGHWATGAVHVVPVFGERGALLEHAVFDLFYNTPLTIQRRLRLRKLSRQGKPPRSWHFAACVAAGILALASIEIGFHGLTGWIPGFGGMWWLEVWVPLLSAGLFSRWAGSSSLGKRVGLGVLCGLLIGILSAVSSAALGIWLTNGVGEILSASSFMSRAAVGALWRGFVFGLAALAGVAAVETRPLPKDDTAIPSVEG